MDVHGPKPIVFIENAAIAPLMASTEPTDRSISPLAITKVSPIDSSATSVKARMRLKELSRLPQKSGRR